MHLLIERHGSDASHRVHPNRESLICVGLVSAGTDPATDLRGTGFLGLMHTLYFVMDPETLPLARDIYKLSQHPTQVSPAHKRANVFYFYGFLFIFDS